MFFYVDESGHTGPNLFDPAQPMLYYGVLSSESDIAALAQEAVAKMREKLGVPASMQRSSGMKSWHRLSMNFCACRAS